MKNQSDSELFIPAMTRRVGFVVAAVFSLTVLGLGAVFLTDVAQGLDLHPAVSASGQDGSAQAAPIMAVSMGDVFARAGR